MDEEDLKEKAKNQKKAKAFYEMEIKDLEKEKLDLWEKISAEKEELDIAFYEMDEEDLKEKAKNQKEETN